MSCLFIPGDLVKLKINSQVMSVKAHAADKSEGDKRINSGSYECIWYDGNKYQKVIFAEENLELVYHLRKG